MLNFVFFFFVALIAWYYWRWENSFFVRQIDNIPGPLKLSLFGNIFAFPRDGPGKTNDFKSITVNHRNYQKIIYFTSLSTNAQQKHLSKQVHFVVYKPRGVQEGRIFS
jgi:hypothetical protein